MKILYYEKRNKGFKNQQKSKNENDVVLVESMPNSYYYEFNSKNSPKRKINIKNIKFYSIEDISKHRVWNKKYPHTIFFIDKIDKCNYYVSEMIPQINE